MDVRPQDVRSNAALMPWVVGLAVAYAVAELAVQLLVWANAPQWIGSFLLPINLGVVIVSVIWLHRVASNTSPLSGERRWGDGWAIGAWFIPLANWVLPYLVVKELWQHNSPKSKAGREPVPALFTVWWLVWISASIVGLIFGIVGSVEAFQAAAAGETPDGTVEAGSTLHLGGVLSASLLVAALPLWIWVARSLQARQDARRDRLMGVRSEDFDWDAPA